MNSWKVILATLVIFGAGVVTGALVVASSSKASRWLHRPAAAEHGTNAAPRGKLSPPFGGPLRKDFLERLDREIKFTRPQRERIEKIISEGQENTRELWETVEPDIYEELAGAEARIRQELTPEQRARFAECLKRRPNRHPARPMRRPFKRPLIARQPNPDRQACVTSGVVFLRRVNLPARLPIPQPQRVTNHHQVGHPHRQRAKNRADEPQRRQRHAERIIEERPE